MSVFTVAKARTESSLAGHTHFWHARLNGEYHAHFRHGNYVGHLNYFGRVPNSGQLYFFTAIAGEKSKKIQLSGIRTRPKLVDLTLQ